MNPSDLTPSTVYSGSPVNNRWIMIISTAAIPLTCSCAYLGLYFYYRDMPDFIQLDPEIKVKYQ